MSILSVSGFLPPLQGEEEGPGVVIRVSSSLGEEAEGGSLSLDMGPPAHASAYTLGGVLMKAPP